MKILMAGIIDTQVSNASIIHFGEVVNSFSKYGHDVRVL